jgi:hypothetical protein
VNMLGTRILELAFCDHWSGFGFSLPKFAMVASSASASSWACFCIACMSSYS